MDKAVINSLILFIGTGTLVCEILIVLFAIFLAIYWLFPKKVAVVSSVVEFVADNGIALGFVVATMGMFGSLFLSEVAKFNPCELCWYQRICMYPQVLILGVALFTDDKNVRKYSLPLSIIGAMIAIYHFFLQMFPLLLPCSDRTANCALVQFKYYGYITIPVMSLTAFMLLILIMVTKKRVMKKK